MRAARGSVRCSQAGVSHEEARERCRRRDGVLLPQNYNDVDLCLRAGAAGFRTVYTPFADLVHRESATRRDVPLPDIAADWLLFRTRWVHVLSRPDALWPEGFSPVDGRPIAGNGKPPAAGLAAGAPAPAP